MAATLKTISERVGISQAAVSMILNRSSKDISSQTTRDKVFAIAKELNYKQKFGHKLLRGDKTHAAVILISMKRLLMEEPIQQLVLLLSDHFEKASYTTSLMTIPDNEDGDLQITRELIQRGFDHFIVIGCPSNYMQMEKEIVESGRTVIGYNSHFKRNLSNDIQFEVQTTIKKFIASGCTNFRLISKNTLQSKAAAVADLFPELSWEEIGRRYIYDINFPYEVENIDELSRFGYESTRAILEKDPDVSALMYISDYHMLGGMRYIHEKGLRIGSDIKLCGVNNIHAVRNSLFPLWTWQLDVENIAKILFENCSGTEPFSMIIKPIFKEIN